MPDDQLRHGAATSPDTSRPVATSPDSDYTLTIDDALSLYEHAGHPRTPRSVQRYCAKGHLDCRRIETAIGEKYLINPASIKKHIAYIEEVRPVTTGRDRARPVGPAIQGDMPVAQPDRSRPVASSPAEIRTDDPRQAATSPDTSRQLATTDDRYVMALERENDFLRGQVAVKDSQISALTGNVAALTENAKQSTTTLGALQRLLAPLIGSPDPYRSVPPDADRSAAS